MTETSPLESDSGSGSESDLLLARLIEEYGERRRAGDAPEVQEFVDRIPEREVELREYLSTIDALENVEPTSAEDPSSGLQITRLGQYVIEREIGRGGMGVVFLATDERLGRRVALKLLPVQATLDPRFLKRFKREARAAAQLTHPHIVPVYGVGEHESLHYYAMQYVEGYALDRIVRALGNVSQDTTSSGNQEKGSAGRMAANLLRHELSSESSDTSLGAAEDPPADKLPAALRGPVYHQNVARIGIQVAEALAYAHSHGILHRDIKPSNLMMDADGGVWVTDFGLCTTTEADQLTVTTDLVGTLRYMAPEQIGGRGDVRSDEYGLGITLYELLTLRPAFPGRDRASLISQVTHHLPPRPRRIDPRIPRDLEAIVLKATEKLPEERYGSAEALAQDLQAFLDGRPITARPPSALHLLRLAVRRNKVLTATIGAAFLLVALLTGFYVDGLRAARDEQDRHLYQASIAAAAAAISTPEAARSFLERAPEPIRNWEWAQLDASLDSSLTTLPGRRERVFDIGVSPDGGLVALAGDEVVVRELAEPGREWAFDLPTLEALAMRPDGREMALVSNQHVALIALGAEPELVLSRRTDKQPSSVLYDHDGGRIYVGTRTGRIIVFTTDFETVLDELPGGHGDWVKSLVLTPDGRQLITGSRDQSIRVHDLETQESRLLGRLDGKVDSVDVDASGRLVASGDRSGMVRLWDLDTGRSLFGWPGHEGIIHAVRFSREGTLLLSAGADRKIHLWHPTAGHPLGTLAGHDTTVRGVELLPGGEVLSVSDNGTLKTWVPEAVGGSAALNGHTADVWSVEFDASGDRLVSTGRDGTVRVWDTRTGRPLRVFVYSMPGAAVFAPDGASVFAGYKNGAIREWDVHSGERIWEHRRADGERDEDTRIRFDPSGERFYSAAYRRGLDAWEPGEQGWERVLSEALPLVSTLDISASGRYLAGGCWDGTAVVYEARTLRRLWQSEKLEEGYLRCEFSPDEEILAVGGWSGTVTLLRVADGQEIRSFVVEPEGDRFTSSIWGLDFNSDGSRLACATENLGISLWDPQAGIQVAGLRGRDRGHMRAVFSPDGDTLCSAAWAGWIRLWDTTTARQRLELIRDTPLDALALLAPERGSYAGLHATVLGHLRKDERTPEDLDQAYYLSTGLIKERNDPRGRAAFGETYYRMGRLQLAEEQLSAAAKGSELIRRPSFDAYVFLAMTKARLGKTEEAYAAYDRAHELAVEEDPWHVRILSEAEGLVSEL